MPSRAHSADPRAERVRARLRDAAFAMAHEQPVDGITVADLVARAGVSRQVFYRHFRDRDDAVAHALSEAFDAARDRDAPDPRRRILALFDFAADHRTMYRNVVPSTVAAHAISCFRDALHPACEQIAARGMAKLAIIAPLSADAVTRFLVGGFMEVLRSWMDDPESTDLHARVSAALDTVDALLGISTIEKGPHHG